jgi:hypothetical protein
MCGVRMVPVVLGPLVRSVSGSFALDAMTPLLSLGLRPERQPAERTDLFGHGVT